MISTFAEGDSIGDFLVERHLASGGNGEVYVARHAVSREHAAVKVLAQFSPAAAVRFDREVRVLQQLDHPGIVKLRAHGRVRGNPYLVMDLLQGETLQQRLARGPLAPSTAVDLAVQIGRAIAHAHGRGVVHRDLKPANVFVREGSTVRATVLDFGIAHMAGDRKLTVTGSPLGTWAYMAPEQAKGRTDIDARADVWALGAVLYEMLAGRLPFVAETAPAFIYKILSESPDPLGSLVPGLPAPLIEAVVTALARDREHRHANMDAFVEALREIASAGALATDTPVARRKSERPATSWSKQAERQLTVAAFVQGAREPSLIEQTARELGGSTLSLGSDAALVIFGLTGWHGDEPDRALRFSNVVAPVARAVGVATGKVVRGGDAVVGAAVDSAVALVRGREGVWLDRNTVPFVRAREGIEVQPDGTALLARVPRRTGPSPDAGTPFVGRDLETAMLVRQVHDVAASGRVATSVIVGAPGIGKSRLRAEALAQIAREVEHASILVARGEAARRDSPFHAIRDALADVIDPSIAGWFDPGDARERDPVARLDRAHAAFELSLLGLTARGPVVFVLEDAQWLDAATRASVRWFVDHAEDAPIAIWFLTRPEGRAETLAALPSAQVLEIGPLTSSSGERLVSALAPDAPAGLLERAAGHPLFLEELVRVHMRGGDASNLPLTIEGAVHAQVDQLAADERDFLKHAAIFGPTFWLEAVSALGAEASHAPSLRRADLVVPRRNSRLAGLKEFAFRHVFCQEVCYGMWVESARVELHRSAGEWLSAQPGVAPDELARHWELAEAFDRAAEAHAAAAEASAMFGDVATTRAHVARVLDRTDDPRLLWRALVAQDDALLLDSDRDAQRAGLVELSSLAEQLGDRERAEVAWRSCYFHRTCGEHDAARASGERLATYAASLADDRLGIAAEIELAYLHFAEGRLDDARSHASEAQRRAERLDDAWWMGRAFATIGFVALESGRTLECLEPCERAAAAFARAGDRRRESLVTMNAASALLDMGRMTDAATRLRASMERARAVGNARTAAVAEHNLGIVRRVAGDLEGAGDHQTRALRAAGTLRHDRLACAALTECVYLAIAGGVEAEKLRAFAQDLAAIADRLHAPAVVASARAALLRARWALGEALAESEHACRRVLDEVSSVLVRAEVFAALADVSGDASAAEEATRALDRWMAVLGADASNDVADALRRRFLHPCVRADGTDGATRRP